MRLVFYEKYNFLILKYHTKDHKNRKKYQEELDYYIFGLFRGGRKKSGKYLGKLKISIVDID